MTEPAGGGQRARGHRPSGADPPRAAAAREARFSGCRNRPRSRRDLTGRRGRGFAAAIETEQHLRPLRCDVMLGDRALWILANLGMVD